MVGGRTASGGLCSGICACSGRGGQHPGRRWTRWSGTRPCQPAWGRCAQAAQRRSAVHWPNTAAARARPGSGHGQVRGVRLAVCHHRLPGPHWLSNVAGCVRRRRLRRMPGAVVRRHGMPFRCMGQATAVCEADHSSSPLLKIAVVFLTAPTKLPCRPAPGLCAATRA